MSDHFAILPIKGSEAATGGVLQEKVFLEILQNSQENTCARVSFLITLQAKKEALVQVFSSEFCEIFNNTSFTEHLRTTASKGFKFCYTTIKIILF